MKDIFAQIAKALEHEVISRFKKVEQEIAATTEVEIDSPEGAPETSPQGTGLPTAGASPFGGGAGGGMGGMGQFGAMTGSPGSPFEQQQQQEESPFGPVESKEEQAEEPSIEILIESVKKHFPGATYEKDN